MEAIAVTEETKQERLERYFARPDTPAAGSPVGIIMARVLAKNPDMAFEAARAEAKTLLDRAAGARSYRMPSPLSLEEKTAKSEAFANWRRSRQDRLPVHV